MGHVSSPANTGGIKNIPNAYSTYKYAGKAASLPFSVPTPYDFETVARINKERAKVGLLALALDLRLCEAANAKAQDMINAGYFDHRSPVLGLPDDMLNAFGIKFLYMGENIDRGAKTPEAVVASWMNSKTHRDIILSEKYKKIGVARLLNNDGGVCWVTEFTD